MRSYKSYESSYIGDSDIAALILAGISDGGLQSKVLDFGEDGRYSASLMKMQKLDHTMKNSMNLQTG